MRAMAPVILGVFFGLAAGAAQAACEYPPAVKIPDGKTASEAEISEASAAVKKYLAEMDTYLACLDQEATAVPADQQTDESKALHVKRYNAAVDAMQATAGQFNEQVRAFKATGRQ